MSGTRRKQAEEAIASSRQWLLVACTFVLLCILVWLNEILDLPHLLLGAPPTPINWREALIETVLIAAAGLFAVLRLIHDVTGRQRAEEALRESEEGLRLLVESAKDIIFMQDPEAKYLYYNAAPRYGLEAGDVLGKTPFDFFEPAVAAEMAERVKRVSTSGQRLTTENRVVWRGEIFWFLDQMSPVRDASGRVIAVATISRNTTERKRAEEALRRRNRELALLNRASQALISTLDLDQTLATILDEVRGLLDVVACSVWLIDPKTDELACRQATGPQSEIVRNWRLAPGEGIAGWVARNGEILIVPDIRADERHYKGMDQQTDLALRSILTIPLRVKNDVIGVLQVVDTEIDRFSTADLELLEPLAAYAASGIENARLVEALRERTVELEARNEDLDTFAHTVAHGLGNLLTHVVGFAETLEEDYDTMPDEELHRYLRMMAQSGRKMGNIVDELLLLAGVRKMEVRMEPLDMASIVAEVQQRLAHEVEERQAEIILPAAWPVALGYGPWVEEVWVNYLSNALKYGGRPEEGIPPRIELGFDELAASHIRTFADSYIRFWVRDDGPGLTSEEQARLFTPFTRLDQVRIKGHGLGLSIVRRIVEKLGGQVGVESEVGQESVFTFTLPGVAT